MIPRLGIFVINGSRIVVGCGESEIEGSSYFGLRSLNAGNGNRNINGSSGSKSLNVVRAPAGGYLEVLIVRCRCGIKLYPSVNVAGIGDFYSANNRVTLTLKSTVSNGNSDLKKNNRLHSIHHC